MLVCRVDQALRKGSTSKFTFPGDSTAQVEILGQGQQFVAFGIHPDTNQPYEWTDISPLDVPAGELPLVDEEQIETFLAAVEELLVNTPGATCKRINRNRYRHPLTFIPNEDLDYDDWIEVGMSLYDALGPGGLSLWMEWSAQSTKDVRATTEKKWPSFASPHSKTAGTLFYLARQNGWGGRVPQKWIPITRRRTPSAARPEIIIVGGELPRCIDEAERALVRANLGYYQRGGQIVRVAVIPMSTAGGNLQSTSSRIVAVTARELVEAFTLAARFLQRKRNGEEVDIDCPLPLTQTYLDRGGKWNLPNLSGVISAPALRRDGSLLDKPGYDPATQLLYLPGDLKLPPVSDTATRADALRALNLYKNLLRGFSFVSDADRAVALSAALSGVARQSLQNVLLHAFSAPVAGSGKSMLVREESGGSPPSR